MNDNDLHNLTLLIVAALQALAEIFTATNDQERLELFNKLGTHLDEASRLTYRGHLNLKQKLGSPNAIQKPSGK